jgi:hypothetical protein
MIYQVMTKDITLEFDAACFKVIDGDLFFYKEAGDPYPRQSVAKKYWKVVQPKWTPKNDPQPSSKTE